MKSALLSTIVDIGRGTHNSILTKETYFRFFTPCEIHPAKGAFGLTVYKTTLF